MHQTFFGVLRLHVTFTLGVTKALIDVIELDSLFLVVDRGCFKFFVRNEELGTGHAASFDDGVFAFDQVANFDRRAVGKMCIGVWDLTFGNHNWNSRGTLDAVSAFAFAALTFSFSALAFASFTLPSFAFALLTFALLTFALLALSLLTLAALLSGATLSRNLLSLLLSRSLDGVCIETTGENENRREGG